MSPGRNLSCLGEQLKLFFLGETIMSPRKSLSCLGKQLKSFFLKEQSFLRGEGVIYPPKTWLFFEATIALFLWEHGCPSWSNFLFQELFLSILFMDEKKNSGKGLNPRPLGYKGDSNYCISIFPLKII